MSNIFSSPLVLESVFRDVFRDVFDVAVPAFSPASLFASGEEGAWYEPSTTTAFKSTTDLTPCGYGDGCGFLLDKSQGASYSGGSFTGLGSEEVSNPGGPFSTATGYINTATFTKATASVVSGRLRVTANVASIGTNMRVYIPVTGLTIGKTYLVEAFGYKRTAPTVCGVAMTSSADISGGVGSSTTSDGEIIRFTRTAEATTEYVRIVIGGSTPNDGTFVEVDNISVRELPGNHATQVTAGARPILARVPEGGRRNELSETDTLATQSVTVTAAQRTLSFTGTGTVTLTGASTAGPLVGTGAADRVSLTFTPSAGTLTLTVLGTTTDAQLELGAAATTYQSVADSLGYDITEAGVTSLDYLSFDGSDDGMATASIDFSATDKMSVFAGVERVATANFESIINLGGNPTAENGAFDLYGRNEPGFSYLTNNGGSTFRIASVTSGYPAGTPHVVTATGDLVAPLQTLYVDGSQVATNSDSVPANYRADTLCMGARLNATSPSRLDGKIFGLIVRGAASTANEISNTEAYLANRSGVTL